MHQLTSFYSKWHCTIIRAGTVPEGYRWICCPLGCYPPINCIPTITHRRALISDIRDETFWTELDNETCDIELKRANFGNVSDIRLWILLLPKSDFWSFECPYPCPFPCPCPYLFSFSWGCNMNMTRTWVWTWTWNMNMNMNLNLNLNTFERNSLDIGHQIAR